MSQIRKQHVIGVDILVKLGLDTIKLQPEGNGHYTYCAWNRSRVERNGSSETVKRGRIRILPGPV